MIQVFTKNDQDRPVVVPLFARVYTLSSIVVPTSWQERGPFYFLPSSDDLLVVQSGEQT
jgi:hypothetical protein